MGILRSLSASFGTLLVLGLTACGTSGSGSSTSTPVTSTAPTTLTGNWQLSGTRVPPVYPLFSTTLNVSGSQISGSTSIMFQCTPTSTYGFNNFPFVGTIAPDGTFQATGQFGTAPDFTMQATLMGSSPPASAPLVWSGSYQINFTSTGNFPCSFNRTVAFNAQAIPPITGTYVGPAVNTNYGPGPFGSAATLSLQLTQGASTLVTTGASSRYQIPLTATLAISGSTCATSGTTMGALLPSYLYGDGYTLNLLLNDGSNLSLNGSLNDLAASKISMSYIAGKGSTCSVNSIGVTTLTRK